MIKLKHILAINLLAALFLIGCSDKDKALTEGAKKNDKKALQALNIKGAPNWVLNAGEGHMTAVGMADIINGDLGYARTEALALARDELARQVATEIDGLINRSASMSLGVSSQDINITKQSEQITRQSVSQILSGTKQTDTWITKDATKIFVLIKLDAELKNKLHANVKQQISKSALPAKVKQDTINAIDKEFLAE